MYSDLHMKVWADIIIFYNIGICVANKSEHLCQTVIEPTLDMWMRERRPNNMVINDPKGELLVKNYVRATVRGFHNIQFNLIKWIYDVFNAKSYVWSFVLKSFE